MKSFMTFVMLTAVASFGLGFSHTIYEPDHFRQKVSASVIRHLNSAKNAKAPVLVVLKKQADISSVETQGTESVVRTFEAANAKRIARVRKIYNSLRTVAIQTQGPLVEYLKAKKIKYRQFYITNMIAVYGASAQDLMAISARADVDHISGNFPFKVKIPEPEKGILNPTSIMSTAAVDHGVGSNITSTGADQVWSELGVTGQNIVVAGQDTGVQWNHPALMPHYRGYDVSANTVDHNYNWHDSIHEPVEGAGDKGDNICGYNSNVPCDDDEHGSHTMGTIVGDDGGENQIGMAPGAKWIACRNMDEGVGAPSTYIECFEFFLAPYRIGGDPFQDGVPEYSPHVINNSWGCPKDEGCESDEFVPVLQGLKKAGIMVVASAGNDGPSCATIKDPPAWHSDLVFTVGAHNHTNGEIAYFSSRGPSVYDGGIGPSVTAPGVNIRSSVPGSKYAQTNWSGTSMAGPHVAGLVALLWSANPELIGDVDGTGDLIKSTATPKTSSHQSCGGISGSAIPNNTYGYGLINAYKALKSLY